MPYDRSLQIEQRLEEVLQLVGDGQHSTRTLAKVLGVSEPTVSRCLEALRQRGFLIKAVKHGGCWSYELEDATPRLLEQTV